MPKKQPTDLTPKDVAPHAHKWNLSQVDEMIQILDELKTLQVSSASPQADIPIVVSHRCGSRGGSYIERKMINGCGPYQYLRYQQAGKYRSIYLGKLEVT